MDIQKLWLTDREAAQILGVSKATIWRYCQRPDFPKPVKIGPGVTRWKLTDLQAYQGWRGEA